MKALVYGVLFILGMIMTIIAWVIGFASGVGIMMWSNDQEATQRLRRPVRYSGMRSSPPESTETPEEESS